MSDEVRKKIRLGTTGVVADSGLVNNANMAEHEAHVCICRSFKILPLVCPRKSQATSFLIYIYFFVLVETGFFCGRGIGFIKESVLAFID